MLQKILEGSLKHRGLVLLVSVLLMTAGLYVARNMNVDVLPDLTAPTVTVMTEAHGMSAEEVEQLVTYPLETVLNGAPGMRRIRSASAMGISIVWLEFDWDVDVYRARQVVSERLSTAENVLPGGVGAPSMAPVSSIMGEMMLISLQSDTRSVEELRAVADWQLRPRLMALGGVANVSVLGGSPAELRVSADPERLRHHGVTLQELEAAAAAATEGSAGGGMFSDHGNAYTIRLAGRVQAAEDLAGAVIPGHGKLRIQDVAEVAWEQGDPIGSGSCNAGEAIILTVSKQPGVNTLALTERVDEALAGLALSLPEDIRLRNDIFRQADFITASIDNLSQTLLEGAFFVILVLIVFLMNWRTTVISLMAIPLSLLTSVLVLKLLGYEINTMSLGGMAIAIGALVDDAIIDVENVYKRLRERRGEPLLVVIRAASMEIRSSIIVATLIILVSFVPLFFLSGMEGRLLRPLGIAFMTSVLTSLVVAVTVTPVMCSMLLGQTASTHPSTRLERWMRGGYTALLARVIRRPSLPIGLAVALFGVSIAAFLGLGSSFLPAFNEGSLVISVVGPPGMSLEETERIGVQAEQLLLAMPEIDVVTRRTGRGEMDEHAQGLNSSEIDAPFTLAPDAPRGPFFDRVREALGTLPGVNVTLGQPIAHRIDHMLSGTRANIAVKIFGEDLATLRRLSQQVVAALEPLPELADVSPEPMIEVPEIKVTPRRERLAAYGLTVADLAHFIEVGLGGHEVGEVFLGARRRHPVVVRIDASDRNKLMALRTLTIDLSGGGRVPLADVADLSSTGAAHTVSRENVERKSVVAVNMAEGVDLQSSVEAVQTALATIDWPAGYRAELGGQYESVKKANQLLLITAILAILAIFLLLQMEFKKWQLSAVVLLNLPLALIGGIAAVQFTDGIVSIASIIGFISLFGIATRNGILLVSRFEDLERSAHGKSLQERLLLGAGDRLNPIVMTALSTALALIPLAIHAEKAGNEIQSPMAVVILGGLLSATLLNLFVIPAVYVRMKQK